MDKKLCTYYREETKSCSIGYCKKKNLLSDRSCKVDGKIQDLFKERNVTNFEYKRKYTDL